MAFEVIKTANPHFELFDADQGDFVVHIIKSGHAGCYHHFIEDAYQQEPSASGIQVMTKEEVEAKYGINLTETVIGDAVSYTVDTESKERPQTDCE